MGPLHFASKLGAIMDAAEYDDIKHDGLLININAPCNNHIYSGDHIEVHIHSGGNANGELAEEAREETCANSVNIGSDRVDVIVPRAMRIVRQIRSA
jgi:hypothetical protein